MLQVEDMLKRSFAEFHAQRSHPEALQKLAEGKAHLEALRGKPWPNSPHGTSQQDVEEYYQLSEHIQALTNHIQVGSIPSSKQRGLCLELSLFAATGKQFPLQAVSRYCLYLFAASDELAC